MNPISKKIINKLSQEDKTELSTEKVELKNFKQICPIEMLDKLDNPISLKSTIKKVS